MKSFIKQSPTTKPQERKTMSALTQEARNAIIGASLPESSSRVRPPAKSVTELACEAAGKETLKAELSCQTSGINTMKVELACEASAH